MILLGLGSNVGDRAGYLARAASALTQAGVRVVRCSASMETPALLPPAAPAEWDIPFLNQVMQVETALPAEELLGVLKRIEQQLGRQNRGRWGPREIDLDLLAYDAVVVETPSLTLPHPGLVQRRFVLQPLAEIAPHWRHPLNGKRPGEMLAELAV